MFIELTDHLRCTAEHPETFLVLLPDAMAARRVWTGTLGCPTCGRVVTIEEGIAGFGGSAPPSVTSALTPAAVSALLGLDGPGGYLAIIGGLAGSVEELAAAFAGIRLVLVNPPEGVADSDAGSVVRGEASMLKRSSMRGVVVAADHGAHGRWIHAAVDAVLPGNPVVVEGPPIARDDLIVLAESPGGWVGRKLSKPRPA